MCSDGVEGSARGGSQPFDALFRVLGEIGEAGPQGLASDAIREGVLRLDVAKRRIEALEARWLAEDHRRHEHEVEDPVESSTRWLQEHLHLSSSAAYAQVRTALQLEDLPRTARAFASGELSSPQVSTICRAMNEFERTSHAQNRDLRDSVEQRLHDAAAETDSIGLIRFWARLRYQLDQDAGLAAEEGRQRRRWLSLREKPWGSYMVEGELDDECGAMLKTVLEPLMKRRGPDDERSAFERRHDGLREIVQRCLDSGDLPERGGEKPHLMLVAQLETLELKPGSRLAELDWGGLVTGESARRVGCDARITPILVDGKGEVLHVGRATRSVSPRMRKALNLRDWRCQEPGCDVRARDCEPHHVLHWADWHRTELEWLKLYCPVHHRRHHPENHGFSETSARAAALLRAPP